MNERTPRTPKDAPVRRSPERPVRRDDLPGTAQPPKQAPGLNEDPGRPSGDVERAGRDVERDAPGDRGSVDGDGR